MKRIYLKPVLSVCHLEQEEIIATSGMNSNGDDISNLLPGDGVFDAEFHSNSGADIDIWK